MKWMFTRLNPFALPILFTGVQAVGVVAHLRAQAERRRGGVSQLVAQHRQPGRYQPQSELDWG